MLAGLDNEDDDFLLDFDTRIPVLNIVSLDLNTFTDNEKCD